MNRLLTIALALGLTNGAFLAAVLYAVGRRSRRAILAVAAIVACLCLMTAEELIAHAGLLRRFPHSIGSTVTLDYLIGPLLLAYAVLLTRPEHRFGRKALWHLVPFGLANLLMLPVYVRSGPAKLQLLERGLPPLMDVVVWAKLVVLPWYPVFAIRRLSGAQAVAHLAPAERTHAAWYRRTLVALLAMMVASAGAGVLLWAGLRLPIDGDDLGGLFMCGSIFLIAGLMIRHPVPGLGGATAEGLPAARRPKYQTSPLGQGEKQALLARLQRHMDQARPYLDMQLSLDGLAAGLGVPPAHLSQVLNECAGLNFYEFVNGYRVEAAKRRLAAAGEAMSILAVAHASGFNSKASFNRAFKRFTGVTPTQYLASRDPAILS